MSGGDKQILESGSASEKWQFIGGAWTEAGPAADEFLAAKFGDEAAGKFEEVGDALGCICFLKAGEFFSGADKNESIGAGNEVAFAVFEHAVEEWSCCFELCDLAANGEDGESHTGLFEDIGGPCTGGNADAAGL